MLHQRELLRSLCESDRLGYSYKRKLTVKGKSVAAIDIFIRRSCMSIRT